MINDSVLRVRKEKWHFNWQKNITRLVFSNDHNAFKPQHNIGTIFLPIPTFFRVKKKMTLKIPPRTESFCVDPWAIRRCMCMHLLKFTQHSSKLMLNNLDILSNNSACLFGFYVPATIFQSYGDGLLRRTNVWMKNKVKSIF